MHFHLLSFLLHIVYLRSDNCLESLCSRCDINADALASDYMSSVRLCRIPDLGHRVVLNHVHQSISWSYCKSTNQQINLQVEDYGRIAVEIKKAFGNAVLFGYGTNVL